MTGLRDSGLLRHVDGQTTRRLEPLLQTVPRLTNVDEGAEPLDEVIETLSTQIAEAITPFGEEVKRLVSTRSLA